MGTENNKSGLVDSNPELDLPSDLLELPQDDSFILDNPAPSQEEIALAGLPEPPSLEELDMDLAQGAALRPPDRQDSLTAEPSPQRPWEKEILSSEDLPPEEPEIEEIDALLAEPTTPQESQEFLTPSQAAATLAEEEVSPTTPLGPLPEEENLLALGEEDFDLPQAAPASLDTEELFEKEMQGAPSSREFFSDSEEEILLSDEELEGISDRADQPTTDFFSDHPEEESILSDEELEGMAVETTASTPEMSPEPSAVEVMDDFFKEEDSDEPITLSPEELDGIIEDAVEETPSTESTELLLEDLATSPPIEVMEETADQEELPSVPPPTWQEEEEGEVSLSQEELAGILEDAEIPPDSEIPAESSDFFQEEEEGPITLSDEELEGILADAEIPSEESPGLTATPEEPLEPLLKDDSQAEVFTENLDKASLDSAKDRATAIEEEKSAADIPSREELRKMIAYLDNLLGELPDETIAQFAQSEYFKLYQKVMEQLGL